ncbi:MAG: metallophosphoesterase [Proteobacteria bacterium]|nr:metallophosphoesterase [Pseudomonadota bacterium]MBU1708820.1 metallophosphoesterase [Pseudomonadota bacterium]
MKTAVISDIHGNLEAFREVLKDIDLQGVARIVCLGDTIGYGPEPEESVQLLRDRRIISVMGNHEMAIISPGYMKRLNESTRKSLRITETLISESTVRYCRTLPHAMVRWGARFVHGSPPGSVTRYMFSPSTEELKRAFDAFEKPLCFVGHTHNLAIFCSAGDEFSGNIDMGKFQLEQGRRYIVNVGSVGQPRDGDNHAKYVIWDAEANSVDVRYVPYDIKVTVDKILALGFPDYNATRLW